VLCGSVQAVTQADINNGAATVKRLESQSSATLADIARLEQENANLDHKILTIRKDMREQRTAERKTFHEAKRQLKMQTFEIERIEKDISLMDLDIDIIRRDMERDQQRHAALNVLKQRLAQGDYEARQQAYQDQIVAQEKNKLPLQAELEKARAKLAGLQQQLQADQNNVEDSAMDQDPRLASLLKQRDQNASKISRLHGQLKAQQARLNRETGAYNRLVNEFKQEQNLRQTAIQESLDDGKEIPIAADSNRYIAYVFVISGKQEPNIENTLHLKSWVESYGAKYIEANWNGNDDITKGNKLGFMDSFRNDLKDIPVDARLILIGHGLGGGAAIEAATRVAFEEKRSVEFLAVLDPIGVENLRANIVYDTQGTCISPDLNNTMTNAEYIACIKSAKRRMITPNIKYFYNRWQKDAAGPLDFQRQIPSIDAQGHVVEVPTASGRFEIDSGTESDQRRVYFAGDKDAHNLLLAEEAKVLPKLLVEHLR